MVMMETWSLSSMYFERMLAEQAPQQPMHASRVRKDAKIRVKFCVMTGMSIDTAEMPQMRAVAHSTPSTLQRGENDMPPRVMQSMKHEKASYYKTHGLRKNATIELWSVHASVRCNPDLRSLTP